MPETVESTKYNKGLAFFTGYAIPSPTRWNGPVSMREVLTTLVAAEK
jgi:hypothetical protein